MSTNSQKTWMKTDDGLAFFHDLAPATGDFLADTLEGLSKPQKQLSPKYFYDVTGSELFEQICATDDYYVTRTEIGLLSEIGPALRELVGPRAQIIEYGAGASVKIRTLLDALEAPADFMGIDISGEHLREALSSLCADYPETEIGGVCADFTKPADLPGFPDAAEGQARVLGFLPGSTIGNLTPSEARGFLKGVVRHIGKGNHLLIGVDLKKDPALLRAAYNDRQGITAAFNLNLLERINRELSGTIDVSGFRHEAVYNEPLGRVEMHLEACADQRFEVNGRAFEMAQGETIHTENSHKFTIEEFQALAQSAGFEPENVWTDPRKLFSIHLLKATVDKAVQ